MTSCSAAKPFVTFGSQSSIFVEIIAEEKSRRSAGSEAPVGEARISGEGVIDLEGVLAGLLVGGTNIIVDGLPSLARQLETKGATGLPLPHCGTVGGVAMRSNVLHLDGDDVATTQLAINRQVKRRNSAHLPFELEPGSDRPDTLWTEKRLRSNELALVLKNVRRFRSNFNKIRHGRLLNY